MTHGAPDAFVLRNYSCAASMFVTTYLAGAFYVREFGYFRIDYNDPESLSLDPTRSRSGTWWKAVEAKIHAVPHVIAIIGPELATLRPGVETGVGLLAELLGFWERPRAPFPIAKLLPILVDCCLDDLAVPEGGYEQLQDIAVPLLRSLQPLTCESESIRSNSPAAQNLVQAVASRLGVSKIP